MTKRKKKISIKKADEIWADKVKFYAGRRCQHCGSYGPLNSHHIFSRSNRSTRWLPLNGVCLCVSCHVFSSTFSAHKTPCEFTEWIREQLGETDYNDLRLRARAIDKRKLEDILIENGLWEEK